MVELRRLSRIAVLVFATLSLTPARADFMRGLEAFDGGDYAAAHKEWLAAAQDGVADAQTSLAELYLQGLGVKSDPAAAVLWYKRAAESGDPVGQLNLADLYARGIGVDKDLVAAHLWFSLAAAQGRTWAADRRTEIEPAMTSSEIARARDLYRARSGG